MQIKTKIPDKDGTFELIDVGDHHYAVVDREDYIWLKRYKWSHIHTRYKIYAVRSILRGGQLRYIRMHRVIMRTPQGWQTHHKYGDTLDNRKENLENLPSQVHALLHGW